MFRQITEKLNNSKLKSAAFFLFILSILITNSGCLSFSVRSAIHPNFLENDAAITAAEAVRAKFGSNARVLEVQIREEEFRVKIQDPENPKNVDSYKYAAGFFIKTAPVRLDGLERNLANTFFDFGEIDLSGISELTDEIQKRARMEGGEIQEIEIKRGLNLSKDFEYSGDVRWMIKFANERESLTAIADAKGNLRGVDLSQTSQALKFNLFEPHEIKRAAETIRERFGARALMNEISLDEKYMSIQKPNPDDQELISQYKYTVNGLMKDSMPPATKSVVDEYFSFDEIKFEDAPRLAQIALEKLPAPNARVSNIIIKKKKRWKDETYQTIWAFSIKPEPGLGGKVGFVHFDAEGNIIEVLKWK